MDSTITAIAQGLFVFTFLLVAYAAVVVLGVWLGLLWLRRQRKPNFWSLFLRRNGKLFGL